MKLKKELNYNEIKTKVIAFQKIAQQRRTEEMKGSLLDALNIQPDGETDLQKIL